MTIGPVVYATETTHVVAPDGGSVMIYLGQHWRESDPIVRAFPDKFSADPRYGLSLYGQVPAEMGEPPVEQATARPGERRDVRRG